MYIYMYGSGALWAVIVSVALKQLLEVIVYNIIHNIIYHDVHDMEDGPLWTETLK